MTTASVGFHCPECLKGNKQQVLTLQNDFGAGRPIVTMALMAVNFAVFLFDLAGGATIMGAGTSDLWFDLGLNAHFVDATGEWYRVLTSGFIHGGIIHIGFNMYLLWAIGQSLEKRFGRLTFGLVYLAGLIGGSLGALLLEPNALVGGASGAVFALMGLMLILQRHGGVNIFQSGIGRLVLLNIIFSFRGGVSLGGHGGGLLAGVLIGLIVTEAVPKLTNGTGRPKWIELGLIVSLTAILALGVVLAVARATA